MQAKPHDIIAQLDATFAAFSPAEPDEVRLLRTGTLDHRPGCEGRYFPALDIAHGMLRDFAFYTAYPALVLHRRERNLGMTRAVCREMFPVFLNYLGYSGMRRLQVDGHALLNALDGLDMEQTDAALAAFVRCANRLYAWAYHWYPWNIGDHLRYPADGGGHHDDGAERHDVLTPTDVRIRMRWEPLGIEVEAFLAMDRNLDLCNDLLAALPFTCLQNHPMVSGDSLFAWTPMTSTAATPFREEIRLAPVGRLRFSTRTGQKLIVQYGRTTEDIFAPVLGTVLEEHRHKLPALGRAVWQSTYETKVPIWLTVERA